MMRQVKMVRFQTGYHELWGRKVTVLRAQDGYKMRFFPESGMLLIDDAKDGGEVAVHASRCDIYLERQDVPAASTPEQPVSTMGPAQEEAVKLAQQLGRTQLRGGAPQLK